MHHNSALVLEATSYRVHLISVLRMPGHVYYIPKLMNESTSTIAARTAYAVPTYL